MPSPDAAAVGKEMFVTGTVLEFVGAYTEVTFRIDGEERTFIAEINPAEPKPRDFDCELSDEDFKDFVCDGLARAFIAEGSGFMARFEIRGGTET